jgi:hypothetical protein
VAGSRLHFYLNIAIDAFLFFHSFWKCAVSQVPMAQGEMKPIVPSRRMKLNQNYEPAATPTNAAAAL